VTQTKRHWYSQLWFWVLVAIAAGILFGLVDKADALPTKWLADAFIQLIKVVTAPVIFCTVVVGIASLTSLAKAGRLALAALSHFLVATIIALTLGLLDAKFAAALNDPREINAAADRGELVASTAISEPTPVHTG